MNKEERTLARTKDFFVCASFHFKEKMAAEQMKLIFQIFFSQEDRDFVILNSVLRRNLDFPNLFS